MHPIEVLSTLLLIASANAFNFGPSPQGWSGKATMNVKGQTGIGAMQLAVTTNKKLIMLDRVEANPLQKSGKPYWGAEMDISTEKLRGLSMVTNSFCAGGSWVKDGTLVSLGGDPYTGYGAKSGLQAVRTFKPCDNEKCQISENPDKVHMLRPRWYPSTTRLSDGSILIMGGVSETTHMTPENTLEFYPKKGSSAVYSPFLKDALTWNLFPHAIELPGGNVFVAANNKAMLYSWQTNKEQRLPSFPDNVHVCYPFGSGSALLPLKSSNGYIPEVVFCGGTSLANGQGPNKQTPAQAKCYRMQLTSSGISKGWQEEGAPDGRIMGNMVLTPDGKIVYINGAASGTAGFYNNRQSDGSFSSAAGARKTPYLYDPDQAAGKRWSSLGVSAKVARMYHSVASLLPDGRIITAGSNPTPYVDQSKQNPYPTEYRVEFLNPPYLRSARPSYSGLPSKISYGSSFKLNVKLSAGADSSNIIVSLHDLGFSTHGIQYNNRCVFLDVTLSGSTLSIKGPPNSGIYPPGPAWLYVVVNGVPSTGSKVLVGS